jgi:hypothetical protein
MQNEHSEKEHVGLYSPKCKSCGHLDPDEPKKYTICHYSKGNEFCPAGEIQLVVVGKARKYAQQVLAARARRDPEVETRILNLVKAKSQAFIERYYFYLEQGQDAK